jgi:hypothetical protein
LIVFEGAEERLNQLTVGLIERLGIGAPPWEREEEDYVPTTTSTSNQLGSGTRTAAYPPARRTPAPVEQTWEDEGWDEEPAPVRQRQKAYSYEDEYAYEEEIAEEDNWEAGEAVYEDDSTYAAESRYEDLEKDAWADDEYEAPEVNLPERKKVREYEQEPDY